MSEHAITATNQRLQDVLLRHVIPQLCLASVASLACSCKALRDTVAELPAEAWQLKFAERLPWHTSISPGALARPQLLIVYAADNHLVRGSWLLSVKPKL